MDNLYTCIFINNDLITFYVCYSVDKYFGFNIDGVCPSTVGILVTHQCYYYNNIFN